MFWWFNPLTFWDLADTKAGSRSVLAFEVKSGERVAGSDLKGRRKLREALGQRFLARVALSMGSRSYTYEDRLHVMPLDRLWRTVPATRQLSGRGGS